MRALIVAPILLALAAWLVYANLGPGRLSPVADAQLAAAQDRLRERLAVEIAWHAPGAELRDLPGLFQRQLEVPLQIDERALADAAIDIDSDLPITLPGRPADAILAQLLAPLNCGWVIERDYILITTKEVQATRLSTRVYAVRDLVRCRDEAGDTVEDVDSLLDSLESTVQPESWRNSGSGEGTMEYLPVAGALIIGQTEAVHAELGRTIDALRRARQDQRELPPLKTPTQIPGPKQRPFVGSPVPVVG
jgi:hypothetical protein